jgi:response regulator of citrate/malate metabolism
MKIMLITQDQNLIRMVRSSPVLRTAALVLYDAEKDSLDVMSAICAQNPSLLLVDDDYLTPDTAHLLRSVRKVKPGIDLIFTTSDTSLDLGKEISQLGIHYYAIKPLEVSELDDSLRSAVALIAKRIY